VQDLFSRILVVVLASVWGALSVGARHGNPYVNAAFAFIAIVPLLYRYTISSHPRSGMIGCFCFTVVSLDVKIYENTSTPTFVAYSRGLAFLVGVVAAVFINWCLWPFVARHELRKSLASMMLHLGFHYRGIVAK